MQNFIMGGVIKATCAKILRLDVFFVIYSYNNENMCHDRHILLFELPEYTGVRPIERTAYNSQQWSMSCIGGNTWGICLLTLSAHFPSFQT